MFDFPTEKGAGAWYTGLQFGTGGTAPTDGFVNNGWYGPPWGTDCPTGCPDALSGGIVNIDDLDTRYWTYKMEWETGPHGHLAWCARTRGARTGEHARAHRRRSGPSAMPPPALDSNAQYPR